MYITNKQKEILLQAEKIINTATVEAEKELELSNFLMTIYYDNCLDKKDSDNAYYINLCEKTNEAIKDFINYCADNGYRKVFHISELKGVEGLPDIVIKKLTDLFSIIFELKLYKMTGKSVNEL